VVLLLTDGGVDDAEPALEAAAGLEKANFEVWVAALGTDSGTPLVLDGAPLLDRDGQQVVPTLNETLLRDIADVGGGRFENVTDDDGLEALVAELRDLSGDREGPPPTPVDAAFLLVLLAIPLFLWEGVVDLGRSRPRRPETMP
jgi:hypothetical protein